ncbi:hypothetical protein KKE99_02425 [Patescibacteria group bacterium]|nr:hypothetical protein [Patescibacteria group bacterium]
MEEIENKIVFADWNKESKKWISIGECRDGILNKKSILNFFGDIGREFINEESILNFFGDMGWGLKAILLSEISNIRTRKTYYLQRPKQK